MVHAVVSQFSYIFHFRTVMHFLEYQGMYSKAIRSVRKVEGSAFFLLFATSLKYWRPK